MLHDWSGSVVGEEQFAPYVGAGNWVGGRIWVTPDALIFRVNDLNRLHHTGEPEVSLSSQAVHSVTESRMLVIFCIIDIHTDHGLARFRLFKSGRRALLTWGQSKIGKT